MFYLQKALNFDLMSAIEYDNGVFWISWEICLHFFDVVYLNWNPKLFLYKYVGSRIRLPSMLPT